LDCIAISNKVETSNGTLEGFGGAPKHTTVAVLNRNLRRTREPPINERFLGGTVSVGSVARALPLISLKETRGNTP